MTSLLNTALNALEQVVLEVTDAKSGTVKLLEGGSPWASDLFPQASKFGFPDRLLNLYAAAPAPDHVDGRGGGLGDVQAGAGARDGGEEAPTERQPGRP